MVEGLSSVHKKPDFIPSTVKRKRKGNNNIFLALRYQEVRERHGMGLSSYVPNPEVGPVAQEAGAPEQGTVSQPYTNSVPGSPCYPSFLTPQCLVVLGLRAGLTAGSSAGAQPRALAITLSHWLSLILDPAA